MIKNILLKRKIQKQLKDCNYSMVVDIIKKQFNGAVIKDDLINIFDKFIANPCFDTAFELIKYDSNFFYYFELAKDGGFTETLYNQGKLK